MSKELRGDLVSLRPVIQADVARLAEILETPEVGRWWPSYDRDRVQREFIEEHELGVDIYSIVQAGQVIGAIQSSEENEAEFRHAAIDLFLDPAVRGRGIGPDAIRALARHLIADRGHHRLTIDPAADNVAAIRAYEKVGFRPVGILRRYQHFPDGSWRDALLLDLLADELR